MMEASWPSSVLEKTLKCLMLMGSRAKTNSSMHSMTTSKPEDTIITDGVKDEISMKVADLLRSLFIK